MGVADLRDHLMKLNTVSPSGVLLVALMLGWASSAPSAAQTLDQHEAASLIRAAHDRYAGSWYHSLTFVQETVRFAPDGSSDTAIWYEAYQAPAQLRIDVAPLSQRTMYLFASDTQYVFVHDTLASKRALVHPLLLLGFDLYALPPEETIRKLTHLGFDLSIVREDRWQGRPVVVVGAPAGDTTRAQFWMDTEHLVFVRMVMSTGGRTQEVTFDRYRELDGGWIAPVVVITLDGRVVMKELYKDIRTGTTFDTDFFDPLAWRSARHWVSEP